MSEQPGGTNPSSEQLLAEQVALMAKMKGTQDEFVQKMYEFMRVTVDIQEVMLRRLNVLAYIVIALTVLAVIGVFALLTL